MKIYALILPLFFVASLAAQTASYKLSQLADFGHSNDRSLYVDLKKITETKVILTGTYDGKRIVLQNPSNKHIVFQNCTIRTTDPEHAIIIGTDATNFTLQGDSCQSNGGIGIWGTLNNVSIYGFDVDGGKYGIHATVQKRHQNVEIFGNTFRNIDLEGIYFGYHAKIPEQSKGVHIHHNSFEHIGWDAIQVGNTVAKIYYNIIDHAGKKGDYGQNYAMTFNPGSIVYYGNNVITNTENLRQVLDCRAFNKPQ